MMLRSTIYEYLRSITRPIYFIFLSTPDGALSTSILLWVVRIVTFSLLLRTYLGPWLLALFSDRIRIRSISLRSIRGLYFRKGAHTWRVARISYVWSKHQGAGRFALKIEGFTLHIEKEEDENLKGRTRRPNRNLSLAHLNPSPLAMQLWRLMSALTMILEPYCRPLIRGFVIACLRLGIQWLPRIIQALSFDVQSTIVTFTDIPEAKIVVEGICLNTALALTQLENAAEPSDVQRTPSRPEGHPSHGVSLWKKRLAESFHRSLDKAWGETRGTATLSLKINNVVGSMPQSVDHDRRIVPFLLSPGIIHFSVSAKFNPKEGVIEPHSLRLALKLGDCSAKVDLISSLLAKAIPKKSNQLPTINAPDMSSPTAVFGGYSFPSAFSETSFALPSPAQSIASSMFSPSSLFSSKGLKTPMPSILSPTSGHFFSPKSPLSPSSPFFKAISASMRPRRRHLIPPCVKLKEFKDTSKLSILQGISVSITSISLSAASSTPTGPYKTVIQGIAIDIGLSEPTPGGIHAKHLGRRNGTNAHDSDAYILKLTLRQVTLEKETKHHLMRLVRLGSINLQLLIFQWPAPFLIPSPFLRNDPNAPLLAAHVAISDVQMAERLLELQRAIAVLASAKLPRTKNPDHTPKSLNLNLPRISASFECGPTVARVIYDADKGSKHRAIELRNDGLSITIASEFKQPSSSISRIFPSASSVQPLLWKSRLVLNLQPVLVRVRSQHNFIGMADPIVRVSDKDFLDDPPIFSLGTAEITAAAQAVGQIDGNIEAIANIDKSTLAYDLCTVVDAFCLELWHPTSVDATLQLLSILPTNSNVATPPKATSNGFTQLPTSLSANFSLARLVIFITAPDISPDDNLDLSRGFAIRTAARMEYCALRSPHRHWFDDARRVKTRAELLLPAGVVVDALAAAKTAGSTDHKSGFVRLNASNLIFKSAVATQFEPDEPAIAGREDLSDSPQDFLRIRTLQVDICLSCMYTPERQQSTSTCDISVHIPLVRCELQLAHIFNVVLGLQTIRMLFPPNPSAPTSAERGSETGIALLLQANVTAVQIQLTLPTQKLVTCVDGMTVCLSPNEAPMLLMSKASVFISLPPQINKWEESTKDRWGEFLTLLAWEVSSSPLDGSVSISVDGDSARLRIPHGFVLSELIHDLSVSAKAIKHIFSMAGAGCYSPISDPEPEGPKSVPNITVRLVCLCVEAQDDPFESKLGLLWQAGAEAIKQRMDREEAFKAKVATILSAEPNAGFSIERPLTQTDNDYQFSSKHTVSIGEARKRLDDVHVLDWTLRLEKSRAQRSKQEISILHRLHRRNTTGTHQTLPDFVSIPATSSDPPLMRAMLNNLCLTISPPSFAIDHLPEVMHDYGNGLPRDTKFSLLVPLHIHFTLSSLHITLRDYPLPLFSVPIRADSKAVSWTFETDLIIGEEMGTSSSVDWVTCPIIQPDQTLHGEAPLSLLVPKTIMPVKTYARPTIHINSPEPTILSWGVSYGPAVQDVMRIVETLSSAPRDPSPSLGFWDKMRLVFHWNVKVSFTNDVRFYMKGTRDPHNTLDSGSGFVLCWHGHPEIRVGYENPQKELVQVLSDDMLIAVPNLELFTNKQGASSGTPTRPDRQRKPFKKICARLSSGVRYGIAFVLERSCGFECVHCSGLPFHRKCRYFSFRPHWEVALEKKSVSPEYEGPDDSYNGFRSDFIHLSVSIACSTNSKAAKKTSNLYLTPKIFAHFWSWCSLFDGALTLPIRQGKYYPSRPISPKLGRHLATIKYRISLLNLYVMHGYIDDSRETWVDGVTSWLGVKAKVDEIQADMHQREEESTVSGPLPNSMRAVRKKPFYAAEVIIKGLELRALLASFSEPLKRDVQITDTPQRSNYRKHINLPAISSTSVWHDPDDFVELDWTSSEHPVLNLLPVVICPHFTYFKRNTALVSDLPQSSKFGSEHTHLCLLGKEPSVPKTQIFLASTRVAELKKTTQAETSKKESPNNRAPLSKTIALLEDYITALKEAEINPDSTRARGIQADHIPGDIVSSDEWSEFDNVYQIHCPSIFMDSAVRDVMMQYYYCSRDRRGFEYHMAARTPSAVKFIRDQANVVLSVEKRENPKSNVPVNTAQLAATALRKILKGDNSAKISVDLARDGNASISSTIDPLDGWADGVSLRKSNCCLLLKPQIVLRDGPTDACVLAAAQAKLQSFAIMDVANMDDAVSGKVMSRNYTSLSALQCFAPTGPNPLHHKDGSVPLEVLIDLRCESRLFERLVPQTDATFHYDKFNRLRLRNNITSVMAKAPSQGSTVTVVDSHLQDQTDLIRVHIPRFTVSANAEHFQAISNIVAKLLLFSDAAHKTRLDKLETMVFTYDFTDLASAAGVVTSLQCRLRDALETERITLRNPRRLDDEAGRLGLLQLQAHIFLLAEELNLLFDAIKLAQDRFDDQTDQKSALLLHASSSEISWRMLDARRNLLSKLVVANINFHWLSRQDSSTVNHLSVGNLTAFDGSRYANWTEILSKHDEPANHPLLKRGLFLLSNWIVLPPVGGIAIYESFELSLHPLRLQIDAKVGRRIMEYVWPDRERRRSIAKNNQSKDNGPKPPPQIEVKSPTSGRSSIDSPRALHNPSRHMDADGKVLIPPLRKLGTSRSFTDLRLSKGDDSSSSAVTNVATFLSPPGFLKRMPSSDSVNFASLLDHPPETPGFKLNFDPETQIKSANQADDAQVMKTRSSQKTFVLVNISSINLLLSVVKEGSFECHDARIKTRELEYRNQTWSFEELVNQFIPSNMSWRGWVKMAFHQPLLPVLPVARELLSKTKLISSKSSYQPHEHPLRMLHPSIFAADDDSRLKWMQQTKRGDEAPKSTWKNPLRGSKKAPVPILASGFLTAEPESTDPESSQISADHAVGSRKRVGDLFTKNSRGSKSRGPESRQTEDTLKPS